MEMTTCNVCGKIFGASSDTTCASCRKLLDIVYEKARGYLRDHPKTELNARELARKIGENERLVEMLMIEGRFSSGDGEAQTESDGDKKRRRLLEDLQKSLATPERKAPGAGTYGSDRHGTGKER
jgi:hypothetical protein